MKKIFLFLLFMTLTNTAFATDYFVRSDGGNDSECTGTTDAAYPGSGVDQACAFNHPFWVLPNRSVSNNKDYKPVAGDTVLIGDPAGGTAFKWGCQNGSNCVDSDINLSGTDYCYISWTGDCYNEPLNDGTSENPIKIYGRGWDTGCTNPPSLWAEYSLYWGLNLTDADYIDVRCLEITDHSDSALITRGIYSEDSTGVILKDINLHGIGTGIHAGRLTDWTLEDVRIYANHHAGWDGDIGAFASSNSGTMTFDNVSITYSGCYEDYSTGLPLDCCSQDQGCYGDGLGTHQTAGDWVITDSEFSHNTSDGLDLLYSTVDTTLTVKRTLFEGNSGNPMKGPNKMWVEDSMIIGNCGYFAEQSFTRTPSFNNCRALGNTIEIAFNSDTTPVIYNNTILGNGDVIISTSGSCTSGTDVLVRNNIIHGGREFLNDTHYNGGGDDSNTAIFYNAGSCAADFIEEYNVCYGGLKYDYECSGTGSYHTDPLFSGTIKQGPYPDYYTGNDYVGELFLTALSPSIGVGNTSYGDIYDYDQGGRGSLYDIGAIEYSAEEITGITSTFTGIVFGSGVFQ